MSSTTHGTTPYYFVPGPSAYPVSAAIGLFFVILGAGQWINGHGWAMWVLLAGFAFVDGGSEPDEQRAEPEHHAREQRILAQFMAVDPLGRAEDHEEQPRRGQNGIGRGGGHEVVGRGAVGG